MTTATTSNSKRGGVPGGARIDCYRFNPFDLEIVVSPPDAEADPTGCLAVLEKRGGVRNEIDEDFLATTLQAGIVRGIKVWTDKSLPLAERKAYVIDGRRRVLHARELVRRGHEVVIMADLSRSKTARELIAEVVIGNNHALNDSPVERGRQAQQALDLGYSLDEVCVLFGACTPQTLRNWLACTKLPKAVRDRLDRGEITMTAALGRSGRDENETPRSQRPKRAVVKKAIAAVWDDLTDETKKLIEWMNGVATVDDVEQFIPGFKAAAADTASSEESETDGPDQDAKSEFAGRNRTANAERAGRD